jgi:hypothetical protein
VITNHFSIYRNVIFVHILRVQWFFWNKIFGLLF